MIDIATATSIEAGNIAQDTLQTSPSTLFYEVPAGKTLQIATWTIHSRTTVSLTIEGYIVPPGKARDDSTKVINGVTLRARDILRIPLEGAYFDPGTKIYLSALSGPDFVNAIMTGKLIS